MIFEDSTGKRWRVIVAAFWMLVLVSTFGLAVLVVSATLAPAIPHERVLHEESFQPRLTSKKVIAATFGEETAEHASLVSQAKTNTEVYSIRKATDENSVEKYLFEQVGNDIPVHKLVLTFDDGPDPKWTPEILRILEEYKVKAIFFVTGAQAIRHPELLRDIVKRGHLVGNHTYSHPNIFEISSLRLTSEVNMTERAIENAIGKRTMLFRSPYFIQTKITDSAKFPALEHVSSLGYAIVGANIDSRDWEVQTADDIMKNIDAELQNPGSHIILLHDSGGDRTVSIDALRSIIPHAQEKGYTFVGMDEAMGTTAEILMPTVNGLEPIFARISARTTVAVDYVWKIVKWLFFVTTAIATLRVVTIGSLVVFSLFRKEGWRSAEQLSDQPVTVIIPAFNEEKTIVRTVETLLRSQYTPLSVVVVDDGSTDATASLVQDLERKDHRVTLIHKDNGGKSTALNRGFIEAETEIIITIDADTLVEPHAIEALIRPFADPRVSAACGNVQVGNVRNLVSGFQALEYITTQNFDRRAFDALNCISVVPGATSAWRRSAVLHAGGFTGDTLAEDADLTLTLLREGAKIVYVPEARSRTEAPLTVHGLTRQRFRWVYGTMQCLQKHCSAFFRGTLGWFALPNILLFHILFPLLAPIGDIALVFSILQQEISDILMWYILFIYIDIFGSLLAFTLERKSRKIMWLILLQRFCYRQFMYIILFQSISAALKGNHRAWDRVERTGTVLSAA